MYSPLITVGLLISTVDLACPHKFVMIIKIPDFPLLVTTCITIITKMACFYGSMM